MASPAGERARIPLFPLNAVLFPGARLPLRIFEPRYRKLFDDSLRGGGAFGVVLIKEGLEVGGPAVPFDVGTMAAIESVDYRNDSILLLCRGTRRFRIEALNRDHPYLSATVRPLPDLPPGGAGEARQAEALRRRFAVYLERLAAVARAVGGELRVPATAPAGTPAETAHLIAFTLPMDLAEKQSLLEEPDVGQLLRRLGAHLERESAFLTPDP